MRRGQQDALERWILNRFLDHLQSDPLFQFPIKISKSENPDFFVSFNDNKIGIEITSCVDPKEEAQRTADEKSDDNVVRSINLMDPTRPDRLRKLFIKTLSKKSEKCSTSVNHLLVYLDTDLAAFETAGDLLEILTSRELPVHQFDSIWVYENQFLFELVSQRVVSDRSAFDI